jgi:hypothetical protein
MGFKKNIFFISPIKSQQKWILKGRQKLIFAQINRFFSKNPSKVLEIPP